MAEIKIEKKKVSVPDKFVRSIHIEKMGNGYKVHHHVEHKMMPSHKGGPMPAPIEAPEPMVFSKSKQAKVHINNLLDQMGQGIGAGTGDGGGQGGDGMPGGMIRPEANT